MASPSAPWLSRQEDWDDGLKAAIVRAGWDLNEFAGGIRERQEAIREGETANDAGDGE